MLNADALAQLRTLKQHITDEKQRNTGTVKGSQGRFGFVVLDDGRELYLPAEQMMRVFPDDRVTIDTVTATDGKQSAVIETVIESPLREFTGTYVVRDNAHFVEPDLPRLSRWIFLPPKQRLPVSGEKRAPQHGDLVRARITRHPLADGKPAARIEALIGSPLDAFIAQQYAITRFALPAGDIACDEKDLQQPDWSTRTDLTALPFVTIDGSETRDIDDALCAERRENGWRLWVAIADPGAWIKPGSALDQAIAARANSLYFPGRTLAMLPETLANERCSLLEGVDRAALVCRIDIDDAGNIVDQTIVEARMRSHARLSYDEVAAALADPAAACAWREPLTRLASVADALRTQRARDHLLMPDRPDYRLRIDESGQIARIDVRHKTPAHQLVEECMVAANRCAADFLHTNRVRGALYICHNGFRAERRDNIAQLLAAQWPDKTGNDITTLAGYIDLIQSLDRQPAGAETPPLRAILSRWLERSRIATEPSPHFGMGLPRYTTFTSPIRKYSDFLVHRAITAHLRGKQAPAVSSLQLTALQEQLDKGRQAVQLSEQWLKCVYLQKAQALTHRGVITHVNSSGFTVRLDDSGIEGFVDTRQLPEKYSFDANTLRLTTSTDSGTRVYQLDQSVDVAVAAIDLKKRSINFQLVLSA
jgi:VacB/RNase II family 3'-5' exoribonuclease